MALGLFPAAAQTKFIRLRNELITTEPAAPAARAAAKNAAPLAGGLVLIQFTETVKPEWREELQALGVTLLHYVPDDAFVARGKNVQLGAVTQLPFVRWAGAYRAEHKLQSSLAARTSTEPAAVSMLLAPDVTAADTLGVRQTLQSVQHEARYHFGTILRGKVAADQLAALAASDKVLWVEPAPRMRLFDEMSSRIVAGDGAGNNTAMTDLGYTGAGVTVSVADSGLDSGEIDWLHPDLAGRVTALMFYGALTDASDEHGHGTHCAGIVAGNGATGEMDEQNYLYGLGAAPGASLIAQRIFDGDGNYEAPPTYETLTRDAVQNGADIGSNSWGDDTQGRYDLSAAEFDALVRDADALTPGDQPYILEFSAGNAGPGSQTIGSPAVAKNVIATGAAQNSRPDYLIYGDGPDAMADFSSRGPCEDGRIKPDVTAPGTWISSARSVYGNDDFAWAVISENYIFEGGTSQAGPHISGAAAVFVEYYKATHGNARPSPALVKAALIHSAVDMDETAGGLIIDPETGEVIADGGAFGIPNPAPNMDEGWGRVDLTEIIGSPRVHQYYDQTTTLSTGQQFETRVIVSSADEPFKVTLTYTDPPGTPAAIPSLVNDLDLEVEGPDGHLYRGNQFEDGESIPDALAADAINNVEGVLLWEPVPGEYVVRVRAHRVVQDARVDTVAIDQDFAVVLSAVIAPPGTGIVTFDRPAYTAPALIKLKLVDASLAGQSNATVVLSSGTEPLGESILLRASGSSGSFTASVATVTGTAVTDGKLQVAHNDTITAIYVDANPAATRTFTARADLLPPVIANVTVTNLFGRTIVQWDTDESASSLVNYGTNTLNQTASNRFFSVTHAVPVTNVIAGRTYQFRVISEDEAGNRATNDNAGAYFTFVPPHVAPVLLVDSYTDPIFAVPPLSGYTDALNRTGVTYDVWDATTLGPPTLAQLRPFRCVIWRVAEFMDPWSSAARAALTNYVASGGSLLVASMEVLTRLHEAGATNFARDVFQVQNYSMDDGVPSIVGASGEPIGTGINLGLDYTLYEDEWKDLLGMPADVSDTFSVMSSAAPILYDGFGQVVGMRAPKTGVDMPGRVVFLSFPLDAIPLGTGLGNNRAGLMRNILNFLAPPEGNSFVTLDSGEYSAPSLAIVEVEDIDLQGQGTTTLTFVSPHQPAGVTITAYETPRRGLFRGTCALALTNAPGSGSALAVAPGDIIQANYFDASANATTTATAFIDLTPPVIANVTAEPGYVDVYITWDTDKPANSTVQFGDSPLLGRSVTIEDLGEIHEVVLPQLKPGSVYYFRVVSRDRAGNVAVDDNGGALHQFTTLTPLASPWFDDMESGSGDWAVYTPEESEIGWELGTPVSATPPSGDNAWSSNLRLDVVSQVESYLISPAVLLTGGNKFTLHFQQNYDFTYVSENDIYHAGEVLLIPNDALEPISLAVYSDEAADWHSFTYDLSPWAGQIVYVAWHYFLFSIDYDWRPGWLVDDVGISVTNITPGMVTVTNNISQAVFTLAGATPATGQGQWLRLTNAMPGQYRVTFQPVAHFQTPAPQTNPLASGGSIVFTGNYSMIDTNSNGIPDSWERQYFGLAATGHPGTQDSDGDGLSDLAEFTAGTNPTNRLSVLQLGATLTPTNGTAHLDWTTTPGRAYRIWGSVDLLGWSPLTDWQRANSAGSASQTVVMPTNATPAFFRLEVRP